MAKNNFLADVAFDAYVFPNKFSEFKRQTLWLVAIYMEHCMNKLMGIWVLICWSSPETLEDLRCGNKKIINGGEIFLSNGEESHWQNISVCLMVGERFNNNVLHT